MWNYKRIWPTSARFFNTSTTPLVGTAVTMAKATEEAAAHSDLEDSRKRPAEKSLTDIEVPPAAELETNQRIKKYDPVRNHLRSNGVAANDASKVAYPTIVKNIYNGLFKEDYTLVIQPVSEWPAMFEASENRPKTPPKTSKTTEKRPHSPTSPHPTLSQRTRGNSESTLSTLLPRNILKNQQNHLPLLHCFRLQY